MTGNLGGSPRNCSSPQRASRSGRGGRRSAERSGAGLGRAGQRPAAGGARATLPRVGELTTGAYEALHTRRSQRALHAVAPAVPRFGPVEPADAPEVLARHVAETVRAALADVPHEQRRERVDALSNRASSRLSELHGELCTLVELIDHDGSRFPLRTAAGTVADQCATSSRNARVSGSTE